MGAGGGVQREESVDKFKCLKLLPLELAMALTWALKIRLPYSGQTHVHKDDCMGDCKSGTRESMLFFIYYLYIMFGSASGWALSLLVSMTFFQSFH